MPTLDTRAHASVSASSLGGRCDSIAESFGVRNVYMSPMFVIRVLSSGQDTLPIVPLERQPVLMTIHGFRLNIFYLLVQKAVGFVV